MRIRTAIFGVYVGASAVGLALMMALVLRDVRFRYVESMRRTLGDTAATMAAFAAPVAPGEDWTRRLAALPTQTDPLRIFACAPDGRVLFDSAGRDVGQVYAWPLTGGGRAASENYTVANVAEVGDELRVAARVRRGDEFLGWVGVGRQLASVQEGVRAARWRLVTMIGALAAGMVLAGWWIAARLTQSLERLTAYARDVRDGKSVRPPASRATEIASLAQAFEEMRDALDGRQRVERYTQALAHEVKAPLAAIRGAAELLGEEMPAEQRALFLGNIRGEVARIQQVIERLLELSSLEARKSLVQTERLAVADLAGAAVRVMQPAFDAAGVTLECAVAEAVSVRGDPVLLRESVVNLLQNALSFSPAGGVVGLSARVNGGRVEIAVTDTGPGVPDYALPRVFERFYSLPRPGSDRKSTGLGLTLVREIAHLHSGEARLENRPEGGARAVLLLPSLL